LSFNLASRDISKAKKMQDPAITVGGDDVGPCVVQQRQQQQGSEDQAEATEDHVLSFEVQRKSLPSFVGESFSNPYCLAIDQMGGTLSIIKKGRWNRKYDVSLIEKLELVVENARMLHIGWKQEALASIAQLPKHRKHTYIFSSAHRLSPRPPVPSFSRLSQRYTQSAISSTRRRCTPCSNAAAFPFLPSTSLTGFV